MPFLMVADAKSPCFLGKNEEKRYYRPFKKHQNRLEIKGKMRI